jgi:hypothetical protein
LQVNDGFEPSLSHFSEGQQSCSVTQLSPFAEHSPPCAAQGSLLSAPPVVPSLQVTWNLQLPSEDGFWQVPDEPGFEGSAPTQSRPVAHAFA